MRQIAGALTRDNHAIAIELARLPQSVRGFGHVKARNQTIADAKQRDLAEAFAQPAQATQPTVAEPRNAA